ncbi:lysogenization regulator HflD [Mergibacter septicus]|uniref:High frequency lysogenization protein HflD homolog n=1 Tax=Mergibacter septicus TaxID=221402 RepID=A0A8D4IYA0_9PAST|nr:high frequency lysogenization protein HflD [Mergibacter septicus]AWX16183.1 lysogenization regulator HflD [Mergibacter septicus]QDJ15435.1 lysogenization regulator HflD [Mergibacter septicus]UTU48693.1 high frequency lysogenization protein HflD [Mergibacter septicus]WMR95675.1 high frequency lysogenization protein HflD [Mergibacter septicus]
MSNYRDMALALAGVCQVAKLVQQFAYQGTADQTALTTSLNSLLILTPDTTLSVYTDVANLNLGLTILLEQLTGNQSSFNNEISRYWIGLLALESKLERNINAKTELAKRIQFLPNQIPLFDNNITHEQALKILAGIYSDIISPLGTKIQVKGSIEKLKTPYIQDSIRAVLLAGIRSAVLWRQSGGSKWKLLFSRRKLIDAAKKLYTESLS